MEYVYDKPNKVKSIRTPERAGLIRARMYGAHHASGQVLMFVDSDCEVNTDWLQPLLTRFTKSAQLLSVCCLSIVCPVTEIMAIHSNTRRPLL
jgi:polypeptide N-acetylgalactosaminyltransferase